jgi:hypothetical protein
MLAALSAFRNRRDRLALPEHGFDVVAIRIENECRVITRWIAAGAKSRPAIVSAAADRAAR